MRFWSEWGALVVMCFFLVGDDAYGPAADARVAAKERLAVFGAVFLEFAAIHQASDDFSHVVLLSGITGEDSVEFVDGIQRFFQARVAEDGRVWRAILSTRARIRFRQDSSSGFAKIDGAANLRMHFGAAEVFGGGFLADGGCHQRGAGEEEAGAFGRDVSHTQPMGYAPNHAHTWMCVDWGDARMATYRDDRRLRPLLAGPALVQAAIGQKTSAEDLGGAKCIRKLAAPSIFANPTTNPA